MPGVGNDIDGLVPERLLSARYACFAKSRAALGAVRSGVVRGAAIRQSATPRDEVLPPVEPVDDTPKAVTKDPAARVWLRRQDASSNAVTRDDQVSDAACVSKS